MSEDRPGTGITPTESQEASAPVTDEEPTVGAARLGQRFFNLRTLVSFAFGFAILLFLFTRVQVDVGGILRRVSNADGGLLALAFLSFYATFPIRAFRWRVLLQNAGTGGNPDIRFPPTWALSEILLLSWFANCVVPAKLGDAYRAYLLKLNTGVSFSRTMGTILAERIVDLLLLFSLMVAAASLAFGRALPPQVVILMQAGFGLALVVVVGIVAMRNVRPLIERLLPERLHLQYRRFEDGTLRSFQRIPLIVTVTGLAWAGEVMRLAFVTQALGIRGIAPSVLLFVALSSALATTLPLTPAGLGFAESTIVTVLLLASGAGLAPGVDEAAAASVALVDRAISYWSLIVTGLVVYLFSKRR